MKRRDLTAMLSGAATSGLDRGLEPHEFRPLPEDCRRIDRVAEVPGFSTV